MKITILTLVVLCIFSNVAFAFNWEIASIVKKDNVYVVRVEDPFDREHFHNIELTPSELNEMLNFFSATKSEVEKERYQIIKQAGQPAVFDKILAMN
ncbi:MAG: hypothetical protein US57_C0019G0008 [Candidatus Moranbacteria bacterium GW2011_GWC2_37_73]|nr:MAG: hypothetical protein UR95_C0009G0008 [Parcubacteria group bacterium GW2011_GWC1_36_108]KKP99926.1 MAG: hypothetical protein US09_C0028G0009 [Candidatus Moranbacteria bacterium GW2011_GWD1_36_198]KKQ00281.1 MAG: hypothetical protein US10_C0036G0008 [Candidatus Moranbacteria bacterium GW2011_GWD2_36_198]KKQ39144.1 MAG: hypothetical protein US57_C0019G0008 [Candidatus Moranbacteria bacterium GW2011_GWC2_37_73]HAR99583.1 hypothetical protein [Candidatus Moranbacteria bacterium]